ncbi:alcohol dehydrogenase catalytic domain-containing protein [Amycolatopsis viridis]|uniref:2-desacetyl-2-hydroxyethyl bacteriochlorophyllide A dehydrogenase n=1 Tax=Amycolatopsis viridis TaxID=185678 RepID=A0ABX0SNC1_9PSEU|nr:alcohol dehydrogenase catalytic domain-containing protein [Amycolatopsis viridis]NIH78468.1 2-desacetyl-2-hydroxyethyl bacteriochlorophyllide A dehydrogenase [Amycolatopsis viridis]
MKAIVIDRPGEFALRTVADPRPGPREVIVRVDHCGVCGTDLHVVEGNFASTRYPLVPGHELAGEIVAVGPEVSAWKVGDRVVADPSFQCGLCRQCRLGQDNLCDHFGGTGLTLDGGCAEFVRVAQDKAFRVPDGMPAAWATLAEPLACALRGLDRLPRHAGSSYLVYGAGTMGLLLAQLAARGGASRVDVVDVHERRRADAKRFAADAAVASADELDRGAWDVVIDATGVPAAIADGLGRVVRGGTFLQFGVAPQDAAVTVSPARLAADEITILGSMGIRGTFGRALDLLARGDVIAADEMVTHQFPLDAYADALAAVRSGAGIKVQVTPSGVPAGKDGVA